ncbi:hypothetical protein K458DRAFT_440034 [Lentithecium fluviatile CBS 122367]|uniref:Zn(2)-C6 fungal-type domain-containing protein n=1 Tax=Lentithecium fluviatile CBS 122367 TaxID=1168545 RepID=A0A6G1JCP1_9PLEO|nr:hypothetical protein K458DRAFT_440034 [Lentithecium fluviatile CBS 122367]
MPRLGHKKSRTGCRQCKARHVKCDESKPCSNCARHGVLCSLVDPNAALQVPAASGSGSGSGRVPKRSVKPLVERPKKEASNSPSLASTLPTETILNLSPEATTAATSEADSPQSGSDAFPFITKFVIKRETIQANLWLKDLELMHHWMADAVDTLSQRTDVKDMWRGNGPKIATHFTYLMHEILALSAFHLAFLEPDKRKEHFALGIHHQDHALRGMRKGLRDITEANASALFATSTLITLSVWASRGQDALEPGPNTQNAIDDLVDIFALIQGMGIVVGAAQMTIVHGPFGPIFRDPAHETSDQPMFAQILEHIPGLMAIIENKESIEEEVRRELVTFVALAHDTLLRSSRPCMDNRELRFLFFWPLHLSPNFLYSLRQRHEGALVVLMYWAVVLYASEPIYWFMKGWPDRTMRAISEAVVDPEWRAAIEWPLHFIERHRSTPPSESGPGAPAEAS